MLHTVFIGIGTNLGDRMENLTAARQALSSKITILAISPIYETRPWGYANQPDFLNQVIKGQTDLSPLDLLACLKQWEVRLGRTQTFKNGPRLVDLDLLFFDDLILELPNLTVPHPGIPTRTFVLAPLADIAADFIHPVSGKTVKQLLEGVDMGEVKKFTLNH